MKKCTNALLSLLSAAADQMAVQSLSKVSSLGWYQPEMNESTILKTMEAKNSSEQ